MLMLIVPEAANATSTAMIAENQNISLNRK